MMEALKETPIPDPAPDGPASERRLEDLVREHGPAVRAVLLRRYAGALGGSDIDDVLASAVHRLWRSRDRLVDLQSPRAWFLRISDNLARDVLRFGWQRHASSKSRPSAAGSKPCPLPTRSPIRPRRATKPSPSPSARSSPPFPKPSAAFSGPMP